MQEENLHKTTKDLGYPRPYLRDGVPNLSLERQREMMRTVGIDVTDDRMLYVDKLTKAAAKAKDPASLKQRDDVLNPRREGETVYLAGLRVLGWSMSDIARALAQAWRRKATVYCIDIDHVYSAETPVSELLDAMASAMEAHHRAIASERQARASSASQKARTRRKLQKLAIARPKWHDKAFTVEQISAEAGLSRRTLYNELGSRWENDRGNPHV